MACLARYREAVCNYIYGFCQMGDGVSASATACRCTHDDSSSKRALGCCRLPGIFRAFVPVARAGLSGSGELWEACLL